MKSPYLSSSFSKPMDKLKRTLQIMDLARALEHLESMSADFNLPDHIRAQASDLYTFLYRLIQSYQESLK